MAQGGKIILRFESRNGQFRLNVAPSDSFATLAPQTWPQDLSRLRRAGPILPSKRAREAAYRRDSRGTPAERPGSIN
ncbi:hypothetical protein KEM55_005481 [Ascosphaera atra]|nr:hypothetical protein KEM55_005481 [Ascosphaera atra]